MPRMMAGGRDTQGILWSWHAGSPEGRRRRTAGGAPPTQRNRGFRAAVDSIEVANQAAGRASHYQTVDNFHAVQQARGAV